MRRKNFTRIPQPAFQGGRVAGGQTGAAHFPGGACPVVAERSDLDRQVIVVGSQDRVPDARRAVICRHADGAGIEPKPGSEILDKGYARVTGDNAIDPKAGEFRRQFGLGRRAEDEAIDARRRAMDRRDADIAYGEFDSAGQCRHPTLGLGVELAATIGEPLRCVSVALPALGKTAAAINYNPLSI